MLQLVDVNDEIVQDIMVSFLGDDKHACILTCKRWYYLLQRAGSLPLHPQSDEYIFKEVNICRWAISTGYPLSKSGMLDFEHTGGCEGNRDSVHRAIMCGNVQVVQMLFDETHLIASPIDLCFAARTSFEMFHFLFSYLLDNKDRCMEVLQMRLLLTENKVDRHDMKREIETYEGLDIYQMFDYAFEGAMSRYHLDAVTLEKMVAFKNKYYPEVSMKSISDSDNCAYDELDVESVYWLMNSSYITTKKKRHEVYLIYQNMSDEHVDEVFHDSDEEESDAEEDDDDEDDEDEEMDVDGDDEVDEAMDDDE